MTTEPIPNPTVTVLVCPAAGPPRIEEIGLSLGDLRRALGGDEDRPYVEAVMIHSLPEGGGIYVFCDENGRYLNLPVNRNFVDTYVGDVVIGRVTPDGDHDSLTHADVLTVAFSSLLISASCREMLR